MIRAQRFLLDGQRTLVERLRRRVLPLGIVERGRGPAAHEHEGGRKQAEVSHAVFFSLNPLP